jgi:hypothetical protein
VGRNLERGGELAFIDEELTCIAQDAAGLAAGPWCSWSAPTWSC